MSDECVFCRVIGGDEEAHRVYETETVVAFLDHRPLLHGHVLVMPKQHIATLHELPDDLLPPLFSTVRLLAGAVERGLDAEGAFTAINVKVSQSVPHLHVHVVPRNKRDGLFSKKLLWIRRPYPKGRAEEVAAKIRDAVSGASESAASEVTGDD